MRPLRGLVATDVQSRQLSLQWENLAFNLTRCHTYSVSLCYRYTTAGGGGGHNTTVRECLAVERNASRFTLRDLPPYHSVHVRLSLANPEGKKEGREVTFQTDEDSECQRRRLTGKNDKCAAEKKKKAKEKNFECRFTACLSVSPCSCLAVRWSVRGCSDKSIGG